MKKLVCTKWIPSSYTQGHIYTLKDTVRDEGYGKLYQFEEEKENQWTSEDIVAEHFEDAENIKASVTLVYGNGREDTRYFTSEWSAIEFEAEVKKIIKKHNRKNAKSRALSQKLVDYKCNYGIVYQAA